MTESLKFTIFGAGALGGFIGGLISPHYPAITLLARGEHAQVLKNEGLTLIKQKKQDIAEKIPVKVITDLSEKPDANVIVLGVKNFHLEEAAKTISSVIKDPIIVSLQNGFENQEILPKYFSKIIYGAAFFNSVLARPGVIQYHGKGTIVLGTLDNGSKVPLEEITRIFNLGIETKITTQLQDVLHSKLVINLLNSLTTLVGVGIKEISSYKKWKLIVVKTILEGIKIIEAAGYHEQMFGEAPSSRKIKLLKNLGFIGTFLYKRKMKNILLSSMSQDILLWKRNHHELESLNGYLVKLADKHNFEAPINRKLYEICKKEFNKPNFEPLSVDELWNRLQETF